MYPDWPAWDPARAQLERRIAEDAALKGTLAKGPKRLLGRLPAEY